MGKNKPPQTLRTTLFIVLMICMTVFMLNFASAWDWDNVDKFEKDIGKYGKYEIKNSLLGIDWLSYGKVVDLELKRNTDTCGINCEAIKEIVLYKDGILISDVLFKTLQEDGSWVEQSIRNYNFMVSATEDEVIVDNYKRECNGKTKNPKDITCKDKKVGTKIEKRYSWQPYQLGQRVPAGTYWINLTGQKKSSRTVDWVIKSNGIWTEEWATWVGGGDLNDNITLFYKLDNLTGVVADATGNGKTAQPRTTVRGAIGIINNSFDFDGTTQFIEANNSLLKLNANISISFWFNATDVNGGEQYLFDFEDGQSINIILDDSGGGGKDQALRIIAATSMISQVLISNVWYHIVYVYNESGGDSFEKFYVNGVLINSSSGTPSSDTSNNMTIGMLPQAGRFFEGKIDEIGIWNRSITSDEVTLLYNAGIGETYPFAAGQVILNSPADSSTFTSSNMTFNCSYIITGGNTGVNMSLFTNETGSWGMRNTTTVTGVTNTSTFKRTFSDGNYLWSCQTCDTDGDCGLAANNRTFLIDAVVPKIDITTPTGTIDFNIVNGIEQLNFSATDLNLDTCWFNYNGTNAIILGCVSGIINLTNFTLQTGNTNLTVYANDTVGNENSTFISWEYNILELNQTFQNETTEGSLENFSAIISLGSGVTISAVALVYNGTVTAGVATIIGNNVQIIKSDFTIPQVSADINLTFNWSIILSGGQIINLTTQTQQVFNLGIDNCSTFTNKILNLTMVDEDDQTLLSNTTIEIAINLLTADRSQTAVSSSGKFEGQNPLEICLNRNITGSVQYSLDANILYTAIGYAIEYYNLVDSTLTNETGKHNITLYDLNSTDSTDFQLTFTGIDALPEEDVLIFVERQYIAENTFKTVELPRTDSNGQTILHLVRNDVIYNIRAVKNGEVLGNFLNIIAFCQDFTIGSCAINLNALTNETAIFNYDDEVGILYDSPPNYNDTTNIVSFDFTSSDGTTKIVSLNVERRDVFGNRSICNNTVVSTSGTVSCNVGSGLSDTSLVTMISVDGEEWVSDSVTIDTTGFGNISYVMWFFMTIGLLLMFSGSKNGVMISILFSFIGAIGMGWSIGGIIGVGSAGIWILVMVFIGIWKINKGRRS